MHDTDCDRLSDVDLGSGDASAVQLLATQRARLRRHGRILRALAKSQADAADEGAQLRAVTEAASQSLEVARASVWMYGEDRSYIRCLDLFDANAGAHSSGTELFAKDFREYFAALEAERVIVAHDACSDPATRCFAEPYLRPNRIASMLDAPVRVGGRVVGVLCNEHVGSPRTWNAEDEAVAGGMADFVSLVLEGQERRRVEAELKDSREQLLQSQKLEAVGHLAGGLAHDFNNLLTVMLSCAHLVRETLPPDDERCADLDEIVVAARRATELTRQLLAFSRKQVLECRAVDVNRVVAGLHQMLLRTLGEHIRLEFRASPGPALIHANENQLEQVLVNLAVNARDAMPEGGALVLSTRVEVASSRVPGEARRLVVIEVTDAGHGIPPEIAGRIFEPFFTTKGPGTGSGLGLSTVYGIVKQTGGEICVRAPSAGGTTFELRFPELAARSPANMPATTTAVPRGAWGTETILVVEDDGALRTIARKSLESFGYQVLVASGLGEALDIARDHEGSVDMLLSDLVMPEASGFVVAEAVKSLRPHIHVAFMSGYAFEDQGASSFPDARRLQKPYAPEQLAHWVRSVLDERPQN